ncbi:MAG: CHAT domain-containing protein [Saprospiraceae bacterium]|nr:CHAT domain-containing protein [Saprospiraceae bacterium]
MQASPKKPVLPLQALFLFILAGVSIHCAGEIEANQKVNNPAPDRTQAREWLQQGQAELDSARYSQALVYLDKADTLYRQVLTLSQDSLLLTEFLRNSHSRATGLSRGGQVDRAMIVIDEAIATGEDAFPAGKAELAKSIYVKGSIFLDKGRYTDAADWYQRALDAYERAGLGQSLDAAVSGGFLGLVLSFRDIDSGYDQISEAIEIATSAADTLDSRVADVYHLYASVVQTKYGAADALQYYERALDIKLLHYGPKHMSVSRTYNNLAIAHFFLGDYEKSLELHKINQGIREQLKPLPHRYLASTYLNIGIIYERLQEYDEALKYYQQAYQHTLKNAGPDQLQSLRISYAMIVVLKNKGEYREAIRMARNNIESFGQTLSEDAGLAASHYDILGSTYLKSQILDSAYYYTDLALQAKIAYYGGDSYPVAASYDHMGNVLSAQRKYREAIEYYQQSRTLFKQLPDENPDAFAYALSNLALCHMDLQEFDQALQYIQEDIQLLAPAFSYSSVYENPSLEHEPVLNPYLLWWVANNKGSILYEKFKKTKLKQDARACLHTFYWADSLLTKLRRDMFWEGSRADLVGGDARTWQNSAVSFASRAYTLTQEADYLDMCFHFMERSRSLLLTEAVEGQNFAPESLKNWFAEEKKIKKAIQEEERRWQDAQTKNHPDSAYLSDQQDTIFQLKEEYVKHVESLRAKQPDYYHARFEPQGLKLKTVQDSLQNDSTLLIEYQLGTNNLVILGIDKRKATLHQQAITAHFRDQLQAYQAHYQRFKPGAVESDAEHDLRFRQFVKLSQAIYDTLLRKVLVSRPHIKDLIIIPHGELGHVPFDLLLTNEVETEDYRSLPYLFKTHRLRYEYSAGFALPAARQALATDQAFVGFAPEYKQQDFLAELRGDDSSRVAASFPELRGDLEPLQFNQIEVEEVAQLMKGYSLVGRQATKAAFTARAQRAGILHLAMHAFVNDTFPNYSHLAFAGSSATDEPTKLFAYELYNMNLDAQLAVLSACETGAGQTLEGEGIMSLARAFKYAGCANIVTSLWKVHDKNSKDLMLDFYTNLKKGMGKAEALRQAKLTFLAEREERYTDPFYWAPFILIGDNLAVEVQERKPRYWPWIVFAVFCSFLLLIGWRKIRLKTSIG